MAATIQNRPLCRPKLVLRGHTDTVYSVAFIDFAAQSNGARRLASGSYDQTVKLWDLTSNRPAATLYGHAGSVSCLSVAMHRQWLATGSNDHRVKCWRLLALNRINRLIAIFRRNFAEQSGAVYSIAFSPDERWLISGGTDSAVRLIDLDHPRRPAVILNWHHGHVYQVAVSPGGRWLASASLDNSIALWDMQQLALPLEAPTQPLVVLHGHGDGVTSVAFSPDGKRLASGSYDRTVKLWDLALLPYDLTTLRYPAPLTLRAHEDCVQSVAFSPDGTRLVSAASDHMLKLWQINTARPTLSATLQGHSDKVHAVAFSPDGRQIASGGKDRAVMLWDVPV